MNRVEGKVVLITGAARGQGRAHAVRCAEEGAARIIALDACQDNEMCPYPLASRRDLAETVAAVEAVGGRISADVVDIRDGDHLADVIDMRVGEENGQLDVVFANASTVNGAGALWELSEDQFSDQIDVGLTGQWRTIRACVPYMIRQRSGSVIFTSSLAGLTPQTYAGHYAAAKHGLIGLMRSLAMELAPYMIRANAICPTYVNTPMIDNDYMRKWISKGRDGVARMADIEDDMKSFQALPIPYVETVDIANAGLFLASDESRYITGTVLPVDGGMQSPIKLAHGTELGVGYLQDYVRP